MDSPASSARKYRKWEPGKNYVCRSCGEEKPYESFGPIGGKKHVTARRTTCRRCCSEQEYLRQKANRAVCFFCGEPAVHLTYCAHHWQQHRTNIVEDHPELSWYVTIVKEIAHFFRIPASDILYLESQKDEHLHRRLVAVAVLRHLTNVSCEKLGILLSRNIANAIRAVKRANALYNTHPEFAADVDAVLRHLKYKGVW